MDMQTGAELLDYLLHHHEDEVLEFKHNRHSPEEVSEYISALANSAVLQHKGEAYLVFGIDDTTREVVGTNFNPAVDKKGGVPFKNWLATVLSHNGVLKFVTVNHLQGRVEIVIIPKAQTYPVKASGKVYLRIGESKKSVAKHPELEHKLWNELLKISYEEGAATGLVTRERIFDLLDMSVYFSRQGRTAPDEESILQCMINEGVILQKTGYYMITNMGALLFARNINDFEGLSNKVARLIRYKGTDKRAIERTIDGARGIAISMDNLIDTIMLLLPADEYRDGAGRTPRPFLSRTAVRELVINMLIHQDLTAIGYAPRIEIYDDRIEFSNAGEPIIDTARFLDFNSSRNEKLARLTRAMHLCEEQGTGFDIVEKTCEELYLPSPSIQAGDGFTKITIFDHKNLRQFSASDRTNLVYMHSCLQQVNHDTLSNQSLRQRFPADMMSSTVASRWITEALDARHIKPVDPDSQSRKYARYVPFWSA